ncbi:hypothetical protein V8G54_001168 [Vigna mungo]|uniref:Cellulose synthase n=1 Tax=Vigna mungo TaxID=3915 RepID=A0AAQ3SBJ5_VIGMU
MRLFILVFFLRFCVLTPAYDAYPLWLASVMCEVWFALSWILDQFPKWFPITRETYFNCLSMRFEREGEPNLLASVDVYVSIMDPLKEPSIIAANTVLSILAVDYPVDKVVSMLLFDALSETSKFARRWVPFCKKYSIEPRAPEFYFSQKIDYLKDNVQPTFVKERRAMKVGHKDRTKRMESLSLGTVLVIIQEWFRFDYDSNPLARSGRALDVEGKELPRLVYISREKRLGYNHHKKVGAMNALVRVSTVLSNAPFMLNLDCDHYINNSKAIREAMCFLMDPR